jgi:thiol-disulfide isomerase/thioredoxin
MKKYIVAFVVILFSLSASAQGIEFFHGTWEEALAKAKKEDKLIFADAFTKWCGPCKRMAADVFTLPKAGEFYNKNFICVKMDMEEEANNVFIDKYPVSAYPTLFFIKPDGAIARKQVGGQTIEGLLELGKNAINSWDTSAEFAKKYEAGDRSAELVYSYIKALNRAGKPTLKIVNEYIGKQTDLTTPENLRIIHEGATEADSRVFELLVKNKEKIKTLVGEEALQNKIETACKNTCDKAIQFKNDALHEEGKMKMKKHLSAAKAADLMIDADLKYYIAVKNPKKYLRACDDCVRDEIKNDANKLHELVKDMATNFPEEKNVLKSAEKLAKKAAENGGMPEYYMTYASLLLKNEKKADAKKMATKALEIAKNKKISTEQIERFLERVG